MHHPMYVSACLFFLGTTLLLESCYGLLCAPVFIGLLALRAVLEERLLREELEGYDVYAAQVKYRSFPTAGR